ncbi:class I SAM-dependent methyltransferase [Acanthopleuribacter pedis]|uniref:Class I SAM-dependent methyltransferase n=1 Tax=Acanthopleuribacter pedis TaxID=442870 RepID=A0A8J7U1G7_9BACT|nr:class I SAM-dependent methyltransferase [Acanthopleuribacter pedis]MBO1318168.1 class I SAM-dependent methyltransferase [Acanthopleuribacter pedis]
MTYHDLSLLEIVCSPESETKLAEIEPWLYGADGEDDLYPRLCGTPVLQPDIDLYLTNELMAVSRAMAQMGEKDDIKEWFFKRYGFFAQPEPLPMDSEILGEGYPGFWENLGLPSFIQDLEIQTPEDLVLDAIGAHHPSLGLDLGCGQGGMTQQMAEMCNQVIGLERNFFLAATANHLLRQKEINTQFFDPSRGRQSASFKKKAVDNATVICGDIEQMPFNEPLFDWVHCGHVLDLIDDPAAVLVQIMRIMKPGGTLSICTPWDFENEGHFDAMLELLDDQFEMFYQTDGVPYVRFNHKRRYILHEDWIWCGKMRKLG